MQKPTFEDARKASRNGKQSVGGVINGRPFTYRVTSQRIRTVIDFDLFSGNHDLRDDVQEDLHRRYREYCTAFKHRQKMHTHFSRTSIICDVKKEHGAEWFDILWSTIQDVANLARIRCEYFAEYAESQCGLILASGVLTTDSRTNEGAVVRAMAPAFKRIIELLQFDYEAIHSISPRDFEQLLAAAYDRLGFDKVVLTPRSGDHGRDLIVEHSGWGELRMFIEAKRYAPGKNLVAASDVRSLLGTLVVEPPDTRAVLVTTSTFAPELKSAPNIAPLLGDRLELVDGTQLIESLIQIEHSAEKPILGFGLPNLDS